MNTDHPTLGELIRDVRLTHQLVTSRDRLIMDRFLPKLETLDSRVKALEAATLDNTRRLELIEGAVADLAAIFYKYPPRKR